VKRMGESSAEECGCQTDSTQHQQQHANVHVPPPPVITHQSSSTPSDDSSSDLMEHFMSELDLVFSDILAEEVSSALTVDQFPVT